MNRTLASRRERGELGQGRVRAARQAALISRSSWTIPPSQHRSSPGWSRPKTVTPSSGPADLTANSGPGVNRGRFYVWESHCRDGGKQPNQRGGVQKRPGLTTRAGGAKRCGRAYLGQAGGGQDAGWPDREDRPCRGLPRPPRRRSSLPAAGASRRLGSDRRNLLKHVARSCFPVEPIIFPACPMPAMAFLSPGKSCDPAHHHCILSFGAACHLGPCRDATDRVHKNFPLPLRGILAALRCASLQNSKP
jgi:hypothetical protein